MDDFVEHALELFREASIFLPGFFEGGVRGRGLGQLGGELERRVKRHQRVRAKNTLLVVMKAHRDDDGSDGRVAR
jgi:hypothetical protein